jgi:hypothetical protein
MGSLESLYDEHVIPLERVVASMGKLHALHSLV